MKIINSINETGGRLEIGLNSQKNVVLNIIDDLNEQTYFAILSPEQAIECAQLLTKHATRANDVH